jgi:hypothetical protein
LYRINAKQIFGHKKTSLSISIVCALFASEKAEQVDGLGSLNRQPESSAPDELSQRTQGTADTKGDRVVERLLEAVVVEENTRRGVNVGVGVLGLQSC